jgi:hypothetical protein
VKFNDIRADDPRWTERERMVFEHLFRQVDLYVAAKRLYEAHGTKKSIWIMANVLDAFNTPLPEDRQTNFRDLL